MYTITDVLRDTNSVRTGRANIRRDTYENPDPVIIIGIQDTGGRSTDGAVLKQVATEEMYPGDSGGIEETTLATAFFDEHPSYDFEDTTYGLNVFCRIPIAYWWRGNLPEVGGSTPRWTMLLSPAPITVTLHGTEIEFAANPGAFKRSGSWIDQFYFGKFRASDDGGTKIASVSGATHLGNVSFASFSARAAAVGDGYHMISLQEWQEICARAAIEKGTFQLMPESTRTTQSSCKYRGVEDFAYSGTVYAEWMDGVRTDASAKYELWTEAGGDYSATLATAFNGSGDSTYYSQGVISGDLFDYLFLAETMGPASTSFIPDLSGRTQSRVSRICHSYFSASGAYYGAFNSYFSYLPSDVYAGIGSRLAKW